MQTYIIFQKLPKLISIIFIYIVIEDGCKDSDVLIYIKVIIIILNLENNFVLKIQRI